jgi:hypothetical protein
VPESTTINVLLLKLKRLLAGGICLSPTSSNIGSSAIDGELSSVHVPENIKKNGKCGGAILCQGTQ